MKAFFEPLKEMTDFDRMQEDIRKDRLPIHIDGCIDPQKVHFAQALSDNYSYRVIITYDEQKAQELYEDACFFDSAAEVYPAKDVLFYSADVHGNLITKQRLKVQRRLLEGKPMTVLTTIDALLDRVIPLSHAADVVILIAEGDSLDIEDLKGKLVRMGFDRTGQVEGPGQFAVRGGIIDIYNMSDECPYRIELWGDEVDSIRSFDPQSQRSIEACNSCTIYPACEFILTKDTLSKGIERMEKDRKKRTKQLRAQKKYEEETRLNKTVEEIEENLQESFGGTNIDSILPYFYQDLCSFIDYFPREDTVFFLDEPARIQERIDAAEQEFKQSMESRLENGSILPGHKDILCTRKEVFACLQKEKTVLLSTFAAKISDLTVQRRYQITVREIHSYNKDFELLVKDLKQWMSGKYRVLLVCRSATRAQRLAEDLRDYGLNAFSTEREDRLVGSGEIMIVHGNLRRGVEYPLIKFAMIAESDIFGVEKKKRRHSKKYSGDRINSFSDLSIGDYVVHENHGIGIYQGIEKIEVDGVIKDYIKISYADHGNLYILATQLDRIQKYAGADSRPPKLNRLGGAEWKRTKDRVHTAVQAVASDLVKLYAARQSKKGFAFSPDTVWQKEFEELFPYEETEGQLKAIEDTKRDMESTKIMDRLICGDVGYGKTEVAIRAAFKAVQDGKQVVVLVPTTILAQQHYNTFAQRMKDYPINVDLLCRFRTKKEQEQTLKNLKKGMVDILIGTHRVLSKDVEFKDLGLLIIDEEQRFGVAHKEKIKKMKDTVDVLTLTATPIPRTLHMSLVGIRDMSVLDEPPLDRMPIQTYVMEYDREMVKEAIQRELNRDGQVYYVFNRVQAIAEMAEEIRALVPEAEVAYAHGQMSERELEDIMYRFVNGEIDVLIATTIIENGLDIPNVNTIIIQDADRLGLSQLYQLRGRVGRSNRVAYAFFMYRRDKILKEEAQKRLAAIREFTDFGSGFRIAMKDLEIRGAGSLLGESQSGHMEAVGYDLYCKMLGDAIREEKGETLEPDFETLMDLDISAYIPATYIQNETEKLEMYKRIAAIANEDDFEELADELMDRYGELPKPAINLLQIALLKAQAHAASICSVEYKGNVAKLVMTSNAAVDASLIPELLKKYRNTMKFTVDENPYFTIKIKVESGTDLFKQLKAIIQDIGSLLG